jgi:hypothetical protein
MRVLDRLLGRRADPTADWAPFHPTLPDFDMSSMRFGALRFGHPIETAALLGRPDRLTWTRGEYCELLYADGGFQLDFDRNHLAYLAFFIGPDPLLPKGVALQFSRPLLRGLSRDDVRLSRDTERLLLTQLFGAAESVDADSEETILRYRRRDVTMEFELDEAGRLKRWNLYPA